MHDFQATAYPDDASKFFLRLLKTKFGLLMAALHVFHSSSFQLNLTYKFQCAQ